MRRVAIPVALSVLVVLAGCIGGGATTPDERSPGSTDGGTPATTATTDDGTTTDGAPAEGQYPPGVSGDGVDNLSALLGAHADRLAEEGFSLRTVYESSGEDGYRAVREATVAAGLERARAEIAQRRNGPTSEVWANETMVLSRFTGEGEVRYQGQRRAAVGEHGPLAAAQFTVVARLERVLEGASLDVANATGDDADRRVTLRSTGDDGPSATLVVDGDGVVRSATVSGTRDGREFTFEYDLQRLGVDAVEAPAWLADAPAIVDPDLRFDFENCTDTYLELAHRGGDALPAGSTITVETANATHEVALEEALDDGTRYLYVDAAGDLRLTATEPPADRGSVGSEVNVGVTTGDGYSVLNAGMGFGCESATAGESSGGSSGSSGSGSASG